MRSEVEQRGNEALAALDQVLAGYDEHPIDLLGIGDAVGERDYLKQARESYRRTLLDVVELATSLGRSPSELRILEVGSYLGAVSLTLARLGFAVTALDIPEFNANPRLLERYAGCGVTAVSVNLRDYALPFADHAYDLVLMCETLEHFNFNPLPVLAEVNRVLRPSGALYLALPNQASLGNRVSLLTGRSIHNPVRDFELQLSTRGNMLVGIHWREYTRAELLELLELAGFAVERHAYHVDTRASLAGRILYRWFAPLRPSQLAVARRVGKATFAFHFTGATTPAGGG